MAPKRDEIGIAQGQVRQRRLESARLLLEHAVAPPESASLLRGHQVGLGEHIFQREAAAGVLWMGELRGGDLRQDRLEVCAGVRRNRPLRQAQITRAGGYQIAGEPGLLLDPGERVEAVGVLLAEGVEGASGAKGAAAALDQHLEAALGEEAAEEQAPEAAPAVWPAHKHGGLARIGARRVAVRQQ